MIKAKNKLGGPDTRHFMPPNFNQYRWYAPYVNSKATINQSTPSSGTQNSNRPYLYVSWSGKNKIKAPTNSRPTVCLINQPVLKHTTNGSLPKPPISTTNCRNGRRTNRSDCGATTNIGDNLPHPTTKELINLHTTKREPSQLILSMGFFRENRAIINAWENTVATLSEKMATTTKCKKPILRKTIATSTVIKTHYYDSINTCPKTYITRIIKNINRGLMDQTTFHGQLIIK